MTTIREALMTQAPYLAERFEAYVRETFALMVRKYGPSLSFPWKLNAWSPEYKERERDRAAMAPIWTLLVNDGPKYGPEESKVYRLNEEKLKEKATQYGIAMATQWATKTEGKLGTDPTDVKLGRTGDNFSLHMLKNGVPVYITQQVIFKVSSKGLPYNQFPALIYVNGKFTPEAKFKAAFAPAPAA